MPASATSIGRAGETVAAGVRLLAVGTSLRPTSAAPITRKAATATPTKRALLSVTRAEYTRAVDRELIVGNGLDGDASRAERRDFLVCSGLALRSSLWRGGEDGASGGGATAGAEVLTRDTLTARTRT